jgi:hypothetical protein
MVYIWKKNGRKMAASSNENLTVTNKLLTGKLYNFWWLLYPGGLAVLIILNSTGLSIVRQNSSVYQDLRTQQELSSTGLAQGGTFTVLPI